MSTASAVVHDTGVVIGCGIFVVLALATVALAAWDRWQR